MESKEATINAEEGTNLSLADIEKEIIQIKLARKALDKRLKVLNQAKEFIKSFSSNRNETIKKIISSIDVGNNISTKTGIFDNDLKETINSKHIFEENLASESQTPVEIPKEIFKGVTAHRSIILYLEMAKHGQTVREITDALIEGGYVTKAKNLYDNIRPILTDNEYPQGAGDFIYINKKWELAKWQNQEFLQQFANKQ